MWAVLAGPEKALGSQKQWSLQNSPVGRQGTGDSRGRHWPDGHVHWVNGWGVRWGFTAEMQSICDKCSVVFKPILTFLPFLFLKVGSPGWTLHWLLCLTHSHPPTMCHWFGSASLLFSPLSLERYQVPLIFSCGALAGQFSYLLYCFCSYDPCTFRVPLLPQQTAQKKNSFFPKRNHSAKSSAN